MDQSDKDARNDPAEASVQDEEVVLKIVKNPFHMNKARPLLEYC